MQKRKQIMKLSLLEQETIITYNAQEDFAEVYTCYPPMIRKLDKLAQENPEEWKILRGDQIGKTYTCPKEFIKFQTRKRILTDELKKELAKRLGKA